MAKIYYFSHPKVIIDPSSADINWAISPAGQAQLDQLLTQGFVQNIDAIYSSDERKTRDAAAQMASQLGLQTTIMPSLSGNDRSGAGFISNEDFKQAAELFYQQPDHSAFGWETASSTQQRNITALHTIQQQQPADQTIAIWGHGDAGTLLLCHLLGKPISKDLDQPQLGCYWVYDRDTQEIAVRWRPYSTGK